MERTFMRIRGFFPASKKRQSRAASVSESVHTVRRIVIFCENDGMTRAAVLYQILPEAW
jgi:hypothetical protein